MPIDALVMNASDEACLQLRDQIVVVSQAPEPFTWSRDYRPAFPEMCNDIARELAESQLA